MSDKAYSRFSNTELILRDELAIDRTLLANERTLMAYLRSSVSLLIAGVSIIHFSTGSLTYWMIGVACVPVGLVSGLIGVARYLGMNKAISLVRMKSVFKEPSL
ncbi:MAG: DUF202 domain-containing protein [Fibrobacterota bacterium]